MPKVSVVMPVYNGEKYLREAIDSIVAQTFTDWEFIIVNEFGSNTAATGILKEYAARDKRIRVIQNRERLGIAESLNVGIRAAKGEYVARMDGDDISGPERFRKQVEYLDAHLDVGLLGIHPTVFGEEHWDWYTEYNPEQIAASALFFLPCLHPTVMIRKSVLEEHKLFYNPEYRCTEDYDLFERILQYTKASNLDDQELFHYRRYPAAATYANLNKGIEIYQCVMKRAFDRMGLAFSEEELGLLCIHLGCHGIKGKELLRKITLLDLLMKRIMQANMQERHIDMDVLFRTLHKRWEYMWNSDILPGYGWENVPQDIQNCYARSIFSHETWAKRGILSEDGAPTVTVLMPVHNGEKYLYEAIKSIQDQTYTDWELLIVNDASTDDTVIIIEEYQKQDNRIRLLNNEQNLRIAKTLNRGMLEARGKYIARMDDDDISLPTRIEKQVAIMDDHPEISVVGTWQRHFGANDWIHRPPETPAEMQAALLFKCEVCHSTIMLRRDDFVRNELFYDSNFLSEDYELWTRASRTLNFYTIQEILGEYRLNGENITANKADLFNEEGQRIVARTLKEVLGLNIKKGDMVLLSGWKNPFMDGGSDQKWLREREEELLQKIEKQNEKYHAYDSAALKSILDQRREWAGITKPTRNGKEAAPKRTIKQRLKSFIKRLLKPLYRPFRHRYEDRLLRIENSVYQLCGSVNYLQKTVCDLDGHLYDYYNYLNQGGQRQEENLLKLQTFLGIVQESIMKDFERFSENVSEKDKELIETLRQAIDVHILQAQLEIVQSTSTCIGETKEALIASTDARILKAEQALTESTDARIWKAEQALTESTDARISKAEQALTASTDARIWKAEQTLTASTDARIWKAEQALTASTDARIGKAEQALTASTDARIWKAEQALTASTDERIWKAEQTLTESTDARIWKAEQALTASTDARIGKATQALTESTDARIWKTEQALTASTDARIWKAEENINQTTDTRIWKMETGEAKKLDAGFWNLYYELNKNRAEVVQGGSELYDEIFYWENRYGSVMSARSVLGFVLKRLQCNSLVDFGCGTGTWLWVALNYGVLDVLGLDGNYIPRDMLMIPSRNFKASDLSKPFVLEQKFDMAMSLEVAEHLPEESADDFVAGICGSSDVVLFSAAHPGQGGDGHVNEQPIEYWIDKFAKHDYKPIDIKQYFASDDKVEWWYKENLIMFVLQDKYDSIQAKLING